MLSINDTKGEIESNDWEKRLIVTRKYKSLAVSQSIILEMILCLWIRLDMTRHYLR